MGGKWVYWSPKDCLSLPVSKLYIWESRVAKGHTLVTSKASLRWFRRSDSGECRVIENREKRTQKGRDRPLSLPQPTSFFIFPLLAPLCSIPTIWTPRIGYKRSKARGRKEDWRGSFPSSLRHYLSRLIRMWPSTLMTFKWSPCWQVMFVCAA